MAECFSDKPIPAVSGLSAVVEKMTRPAVPCGCAVCITAAIQSPNAERGQLSACESIRRKRARTLLGTRKPSPERGYLITDLARFLELDVNSLRVTAKRLGLLRTREGDRWYAPLTRREAKRLIQHVRVKHHGP
jgi:hypothetical protein